MSVSLIAVKELLPCSKYILSIMKKTNIHSLQLLYEVPFEYKVRQLGLLGVYTNAFLSKSLDNSFHNENWDGHPLLTEWRCEFRRESGLTLAANWLAEWFVLLRMQGANALRLHFEKYDQFQQLHFGIYGTPPHAVLSAWRNRMLSESCLSSWTWSVEQSLACRMYDNLNEENFKFSCAMPGDLSTDLVLETARVLDSAPQVCLDFSVLCAHLDELFATGKKAGYVMADLPKDSATRVKFAETHFASTENSYTHEFAPYPCFPNSPQADPMRHVFIDAGILYGQMSQVPERTPLNHHDDVNRGPIFPASDADGKIYDLLFEQLIVLGKSWLQLCYSSWTKNGASSDDYLMLRDPVDIAYLGSFHRNRSGEECISWARPKPPRPPIIRLFGERNEIVPQTGWWESTARPNGKVMHYFEAGQRFPPNQFTKIGEVTWSYNSYRQPPAPYK